MDTSSLCRTIPETTMAAATPTPTRLARMRRKRSSVAGIAALIPISNRKSELCHDPSSAMPSVPSTANSPSRNAR